MFAFEYYPTGDYINVYFDMKNYYFDYNELINNFGVVKKGGCDKILNKMKDIRFLKIHQAIVLLDCFLRTENVQAYILYYVYPMLVKYKKSLII
ncbi:hypothetical protein [Alphabaculovirus altersperidaniae]|uniref:Uncharacterized protein n=1 Tax=Spodoptera eridania nucleopolyhedrovirus TaxID=2315721 RepID=A0ABX6TS67_9ABAC|nr:hypothetical protein QKS47_gp132 [Spodoptera eridania nucleopolyhedrovirus]QNV47842.1 hypothetical protein [Spodoptera eridania nucleopolyhedrovirus]